MINASVEQASCLFKINRDIGSEMALPGGTREREKNASVEQASCLFKINRGIGSEMAFPDGTREREKNASVEQASCLFKINTDIGSEIAFPGSTRERETRKRGRLGCRVSGKECQVSGVGLVLNYKIVIVNDPAGKMPLYSEQIPGGCGVRG